MSYKKKKDYSDEMAIDSTIERSVHINKPDYRRGSGNNRSCYINDHHDKAVYVPDTQVSDTGESMQDAVGQETIEEEKMTDEISTVGEMIIVNDLEKNVLDKSNTAEIEKTQEEIKSFHKFKIYVQY